MILGLFRKKDPQAASAAALYATAVERARRPAFYGTGGVPDSLDGRFDFVALHVYLVLRRLKGEGESAAALAQSLFDLMFDDMEQNLRQIGVSDIKVGNRVKDMAKAFYGRIEAYDRGLAEGDAVLGDALRRNLFRGTTPDEGQVAAMADYLRFQVAFLQGQDLAGLLAGNLAFGPVGQEETP